MRAIGLDVHLDFCEVAIVEDGDWRSPPAPRRSASAAGIWSANDAVRQAERELARQAEVAYARTVRDWHAAQTAKVGLELETRSLLCDCGRLVRRWPL